MARVAAQGNLVMTLGSQGTSERHWKARSQYQRQSDYRQDLGKGRPVGLARLRHPAMVRDAKPRLVRHTEDREQSPLRDNSPGGRRLTGLGLGLP